jgi:sterol desaturase/sphingolipid hydroxylase (fatty acid hydroxylase superfamily)
VGELFLENETEVRFSVFIGVLLVMGLWEMLAPRRSTNLPRRSRWLSNLGLLVANALILRFAFPIAAVGAASFASQRGWGIMNVMNIPPPIGFLLAIVALDLLIYGQHVLFHRLPILWRLHRVHHTDLAFDVTTGVRFHPLEIMLSMVFKMLGVVLLGAPALAVLAFEVLLNGLAMFNHSNVKIPGSTDAVLRMFIVTPDMHRVHHSVLPVEHNANYGFCLPWWDQIFKTYRRQPRDGHGGMVIGLSRFSVSQSLGFFRLLFQPLQKVGEERE